MGKKLTLRIVGKYGWKNIEVRESLKANNLKAIIAGKMQPKGTCTKIAWEGKELTGHMKLKDLGIVDGG